MLWWLEMVQFQCKGQPDIISTRSLSPDACAACSKQLGFLKLPSASFQPPWQLLKCRLNEAGNVLGIDLKLTESL